MTQARVLSLVSNVGGSQCLIAGYFGEGSYWGMNRHGMSVIATTRNFKYSLPIQAVAGHNHSWDFLLEDTLGNGAKERRASELIYKFYIH